LDGRVLFFPFLPLPYKVGGWGGEMAAVGEERWRRVGQDNNAFFLTRRVGGGGLDGGLA